VLLAVDGVVVAAAGFGDPIRPGARDAIAALRQRGWRTVLLSGDAPPVVAAVGAALGFASADAIGGASPEEKEAHVRALRRDHPGVPVVMVGDGVNDAVALAAAHVGVGVHGGAEASLVTADVHLTTPGLLPLLDLVDGAARTLRLIRRNMGWALAYNAVGIALAMTGVLSPLIAAILMPASSLTVVSASWLGRSFGPATAGREAASPPVGIARARAA
jgi:Cu2+-exporting ATPase